jgi:hypothetical protein
VAPEQLSAADVTELWLTPDRAWNVQETPEEWKWVLLELQWRPNVCARAL